MADATDPADDLGAESTPAAIHAAAEFVQASYSWCLARYEAADNRLGALVTLASSVTLGGPVLGGALFKDSGVFRAPAFWMAVICGALAMLVALVARTRGSVQLLNPGQLLTKRWQVQDPSEVERWLVYYAGRAFTENARRIERKGRANDAATFLVILEVLAFAVWLATAW